MYLVLKSCTPLQLILLFEKKHLVFICSVSETRVHMEAWRDGLVTSPSCQGQVQPVQRLSLSWGISGVLPPLQSEVQMFVVPFLHLPPPALLSVTILQPAWSHHAPCAQGCAQCCGGQWWGSPMGWPEMCSQSLPRSSVGCSCLQNHQLEIFVLFFFAFYISQFAAKVLPYSFARCHGLLPLNSFPMKSINTYKSSGSWQEVKTPSFVLLSFFFSPPLFLRQINVLSLMAYFGQTSNPPILLCVCLEKNVAIFGVKRTAMGWGTEHLPMGSSSSGFVFRHLFCLLCWPGYQMEMGEGCVDVHAVFCCCSTVDLCHEFLWCGQGAEGAVEQMEENLWVFLV